jgi:sugar transferase (PEP-CTERM/EpsH1 system associated)
MSDKPSLLFLCHRIPYPPNKGDKIRSFNILKHLSEQFEIHLGFFIDDKNDLQYVCALESYCQSIHYEVPNKLWSLVKGCTGFLTRQAITLSYYSSQTMADWVDTVCSQNNIQKTLVFSSAMAQFVENANYSSHTKVLDFVDVDSDKWRQYAANLSGVKKWFYGREADKLALYEKKMCAYFDASVFVSQDEMQMFQTLLPAKLRDKVLGINNGVDVQYFDPDKVNEHPRALPPQSIVFAGAMDYWANANAMLWFVDLVWPLVQAEQPDCQLFIVGSNPGSDIRALNILNNITVTGRVSDIRPYIKFAKVSIAPLRIARGIQNKVLEALSMQRPVVLTSMAATGIHQTSSLGYTIADDPLAFAKGVLAYLAAEQDSFNGNRQFVMDNFSWALEMQKFVSLLHSDSAEL